MAHVLFIRNETHSQCRHIIIHMGLVKESVWHMFSSFSMSTHPQCKHIVVHMGLVKQMMVTTIHIETTFRHAQSTCIQETMSTSNKQESSRSNAKASCNHSRSDSEGHPESQPGHSRSDNKIHPVSQPGSSTTNSRWSENESRAMSNTCVDH